MARVLVVYGTGEGQTAKVAERITESLGESGHAAEAFDVERLPDGVDLASYDGVVVGASIHMGRHQKGVRSFVRTHRETLETIPSGFFQLSLSAAMDDEAHRVETMGYVDALIEDTGWHPDRVAVLGGALRYSEYGFITRSLMKSIARAQTGDTDTSRDYEYTDWDEVRQFAEEFGTFVEEQRALHAATESDAGVESRS
jgi:menaquinone-dependent protoporphyrinogen oxidase